MTKILDQDGKQFHYWGWMQELRSQKLMRLSIGIVTKVTCEFRSMGKSEI